jgi:hypothetical protein
MFNAGWDETLTTLCLRERQWKYLNEGYPGQSWMVHPVLGDSSTQSQKGAPNLPMLTIPSPPALEREGQSSPVSQESGLQVPESQNTVMESGGLFPGRGGQGADLSVQSIGSGASKQARE